ncbi:LiaF transmembrane domain-containing protein [Brevibacillus sp. TJ4]|uniref:LiaF transmembrane domain-containing protein n=1 Tax=Brevibacillus sp. TJ4 TaxID=3234853 RepID=UPI0037D91B3E
MGERSGKILLGLVLLMVGGLILLDLIGIDGGRIIGLLIAAVIMVYGIRKMMRSTGSRIWGVLIFLFGFLMLIGKLNLFFTSLLAIGVIYIGYKLIRSQDDSEQAPSEWERQWAKRVLRESESLDQWEERLTRNKQ